MKKVLLIAYYFPPLGGIGVRRSLRYYKNLPLYNWQPYILTTKKATLNDRHIYGDQTLMKEITEDNIYRTRLVDITYFVSFLNKLRLYRVASLLHRFIYPTPPDHCITWLPFALFRSLKLFYRFKFDAIYSTSAPYTAHLIGLILKRLTKKPWIVDLRDPWTQEPNRKLLFQWQAKLDCWMERKVFAYADLITITTRHYLHLIEKVVPLNKKVRVITNGFNPEDFKMKRKNNNNKFRIVYTGVFYGYRNPRVFFNVVKKLINKGDIDKDNIELCFIGYSRDIFFKPIIESGLLPILKRYGHVSHSEAIRHMQNSDVLLLMVASEEPYQIPGKTFEYCASGKPIIAIVPCDGAAAEILRCISADYLIADPSNSKQIENAIQQYYNKWQSGELRICQNKKSLFQYTDYYLTGKLVNLMNESWQIQY